jgi:hypothetical protein
MDAPITFPTEDRILSDAVQEFCRTLSRTTGSTVLLVDMPNNLFLRRHTSRGAAKEAARDVLSGILLETGRSLVWRLNCDGGTGRYFLNIKVAVMEVTNLRGEKVAREIPLPSKK